MTKKEDLEFYLDNGLEEIISDEPNNYLLEKDVTQVAPVQKKENVISVSAKVNKITSTSEALSLLAKKQQNNESVNTKFMLSIEDLVKKAKEVAATAKDINELKQAVENFDGCNLKKMATNTVFSDGNPDSKIMVIGEAPGNHEDLQGIPFCGDSGQLLDAIFKSINYSRDKNFYLTNTIFWRPPGNRKPTEEELIICKPFLERHIELFNPILIILVGATAMTSVLGITDTISDVRGKFIDFSPTYLNKTIKSFTIFHPSYLMRQPARKKTVWLDMLAVEEFMKKND